jgi:N-methylhydantoinase B/oxoprolinase/acetone carboxylase alpha subunit
MKKTIITIVAVLLMNIASFSQVTIEGVTLPATFNNNNKELLLNGGGLREKFFLDLYVGGLYLTNKTSDANKIIAANESMSIKIQIVSTLIDSKKMIDAVEEGMGKSTKGNKEKFRKEIEQFKGAFKDEIKIGDVYDIVYHPESGTSVYKNNIKNTAIEGYEFKKALFGIWLCDEPADKNLKKGMLNTK